MKPLARWMLLSIVALNLLAILGCSTQERFKLSILVVEASLDVNGSR